MEQISIFDDMYPKYKNNKPIRLIELFAGYGSQALALKYLNIPFEHYKICEFDKTAIKTYNEIHGTIFEASDIKNIKASNLKIEETNKYTYLITYSFPCTDLSLAGKRQGMSKDSGTRSGLLWEVERILLECKDKELPQLLLMENVPQVICSDFNDWQLYLEKLGYKNYTQILNAKDYGIPQNRNRCFMVSILGDYSYSFPQPIKLDKRLKDLLEDNVDEKYYLSEKALNGLKNTQFQCSKIENRVAKGGIIPTILARDYKDPKLVLVAQLNGFESSGRIYSEDGLAPTINTMGGGNREPKIATRLDKTLEKNSIEDGDFIDSYNQIIRKGISGTITTRVSESNNTFIAIKNATKQGYIMAEDGDGVDISGRMEYHRGTVQKGMAQTIKTSNDVGVVVSIKEDKKYFNLKKYGSYYTWKNKQGKYNTQCNRAASPEKCALTIACTEPGKVINNLRIRKLTPKECFRLMGVRDSDINKITCSNSQKYKLAGNSIVVNVLMAIFKELFD